jgi:hypothetical protein
MDHLYEVIFESGTKLNTIGPSALSDCKSLVRIAIPASVERIEKSAFKRCDELASCLMNENSILVTIGANAFEECF